MSTLPKLASIILLGSAHMRAGALDRLLDQAPTVDMYLVCLDTGALRAVETLLERAVDQIANMTVVDATAAPSRSIAGTLLAMDADYVQLSFDLFLREPQTFDFLAMELFLRPVDIVSLDYMVERGGVVHHRATALNRRTQTRENWQGHRAIAADLSANILATDLVRTSLPLLLSLPRAAHWWRIALTAMLPADGKVRHLPLIAGILQNDGPLTMPLDAEDASGLITALLRRIAPVMGDADGYAGEAVLALRCCRDLPPVLNAHYRGRLLAMCAGVARDRLLPFVYDALQLTGLTNGEISTEEQRRTQEEACQAEVALLDEARWAVELLAERAGTASLLAQLAGRTLRAEQEASQWRAMIAAMQSDLFSARMQSRNWKLRYTRAVESKG